MQPRLRARAKVVGGRPAWAWSARQRGTQSLSGLLCVYVVVAVSVSLSVCVCVYVCVCVCVRACSKQGSIVEARKQLWKPGRNCGSKEGIVEARKELWKQGVAGARSHVEDARWPE